MIKPSRVRGTSFARIRRRSAILFAAGPKSKPVGVSDVILQASSTPPARTRHSSSASPLVTAKPFPFCRDKLRAQVQGQGLSRPSGPPGWGVCLIKKRNSRLVFRNSEERFARSIPQVRPLSKCWSAVGIVTQACLFCSQTERIGTMSWGSTKAPMATPVTSGFFAPRKNTVDPQSGQK